MISFGAGVNSVAMTIMLFKRGEIMPVVFVDTGVEHPETYCYMDYFEREFMSQYGQRIIRLDPKKAPFLYPERVKGVFLDEYCLNAGLIPFRMNRFCTGDWKEKPLVKWQQLRHINPDNVNIGFALDESHRAKGGSQKYPLIDAKLNRQGCIELIEAIGLARPRKSGCFFCPFQRLGQWEELYRKYPELFWKARGLEENLIKKRPEEADVFWPGSGGLHILAERFDAKGGDLFPDFDFEELTPCACML